MWYIMCIAIICNNEKYYAYIKLNDTCWCRFGYTDFSVQPHSPDVLHGESLSSPAPSWALELGAAVINTMLSVYPPCSHPSSPSLSMKHEHTLNSRLQTHLKLNNYNLDAPICFPSKHTKARVGTHNKHQQIMANQQQRTINNQLKVESCRQGTVFPWALRPPLLLLQFVPVGTRLHSTRGGVGGWSS